MSFDNNSGWKEGKKKDFLSKFAIAIIVIGILLSISGIGAVVGIPIAGVGGIGYAIFHLGLLSNRSKGFAMGCLICIVLIVVIISLVLIPGLIMLIQDMAG